MIIIIKEYKGIIILIIFQWNKDIINYQTDKENP